MSETFVYSSTSPKVLAAWMDFEKVRRAFPQRIARIEAAVGRQTECLEDDAGCVGIRSADTDFRDGLPEGWRQARHYLVPDLRTKVGRMFADCIREASGPERCVLPGMPDVYIDDDGAEYQPGVHLLHGAVLVKWQIPMGGKYDYDLWQENSAKYARPVIQEMARV